MSFWDWLDKVLYPHGHGKHIAPKETKETKEGVKERWTKKQEKR